MLLSKSAIVAFFTLVSVSYLVPAIYLTVLGIDAPTVLTISAATVGVMVLALACIVGVIDRLREKE